MIHISTTTLSETIQITDMLGHVLITNLSTGNNTDISISNLPGGSYFCKIGKTQIMFVKQ